MFQFIKTIFICFSLISCTSSKDFWYYALAETAMERAKRRKAIEMSPVLYSQARSQFGIGLISFQNKDYNKANEHFQKAQALAEKAEMLSFLKGSQGGVLY